MKKPHFTLCVGIIASLAIASAILPSLPAIGSAAETTRAAATHRAPTTVRFSENFDAVTSPALPVGWSTSRVGANAPFESRPGGLSLPNSLFTNNPNTGGAAEVTSPVIALGNSRARLIFNHSYQTDHRGDDGGSLEVSVNSGPFLDVVQAGGEFVGGRYLGLIGSAATGNPLMGRQVWNFDSDGYKTTIVNLPLSFANSNVRFRWRYGTNDMFEGIGWHIDDVRVEDFIPSRVLYREDFDSIPAPDLPAGWTTAESDPVRAFRTSTEGPYTAPNSVFTPVPAAAGSASLISPPIHIGGNSPKLNFQHRYACDQFNEGGVLEISINGGPFRDILDAGGQFRYGGYNETITANNNPLNGREAWTGATQGMIFTQVELPPAAFGQSVQFKWEWGTDPFILSIGWWIDSVEVTDDLSGANLSGIVIPESGIASPYPSEIEVSNHVGLISKVSVNLVNFSHTLPDDVDLLLVAPNGRKVVLMSDVGGNIPVTNLSMTFDDKAGSALPDTTALASGSFRPTDYEPGDSYPVPAPGGAIPARTLGFLNGSEPNGTWRLFAVDDSGNNAGNVGGGWSLAVETSPNVVTVPDTGVANPYPSQVNISGRQGTVTKVVAQIRNFSHTSPDDVDIMLVAPNGRRVIVMSDVGGASEVGSVDVTIDDDAPGQIPDDSALTTGTFRPTNHEPGDSFPAPAPQGSATGSTLSSFFGSAPNGTWNFYVVDDAGNNFGSISGEWGLTLTTSTGACAFTISAGVFSFPAPGGSGAVDVAIPSGCPWTATPDSSFVSVTSGASGEGNGRVSFSLGPNSGPPRTAAINITNGVMSRSLLIQQAAGQVRRSPFDFDGDSRSDISIFRPGAGEWWYARSSDGQVGATVFGAGSDIITPGDFTGDGKTDLAFFRPGTGEWFVLRSEDSSFSAFPFGQNGDIPTPADYDADGRTDPAVFRSGTWFIAQSGGGTIIRTFGIDGDRPVPGDYDNDGRADIAIVRNNAGAKEWWIQRSSAGVLATVFGSASDKAVQGDYTGDGKVDAALWRESTGQWIVLRSEDLSYFGFSFGQAGDVAVPGDYDGDGRFDAGVFRPASTTWFVNRSGGSGVLIAAFGHPTDLPVPGAYVR